MLADDTLVTRIVVALPASPMLLPGGMNTAPAQGSGALGSPALEGRFHYKPSVGTTSPLLYRLLMEVKGYRMGTRNQECRYDNLGWFPYLSSQVHLAVVAGSTGERDAPAPASVPAMYYCPSVKFQPAGSWGLS